MRDFNAVKDAVATAATDVSAKSNNFVQNEGAQALGFFQRNPWIGYSFVGLVAVLFIVGVMTL